MCASKADGAAVWERRRHALRLAEHETFVPQSYNWGVDAQVLYVRPHHP